MNPVLEEQITSVFGGLVLGEQSCWTSLFERSLLMPFWTRRKRREIDVQHEIDNLLTVTLPFALNQPTEALVPGPGPRAEWFIFQLQLFIGKNGDASYSLERTTAAWLKLAAEASDLRLTLSQLAALTNLRDGKTPPVTGHDNPHYFDDTACYRSLVTAIFYADDLGTALEATRLDAGITNAEDGIWGAQAITAALVMAVRGADPSDCVDAAVQQLPKTSWIFEATTRALACVQEGQTAFDLVAKLEATIVNHAYNYGDAAPETLPAVLATIMSTRGDVERAFLVALALPRITSSLAPLLGAFCGALGTLPDDALATLRTPLRGVALPFLAGTTLLGTLSGRAGGGIPHGPYTL
ncbi:MAG: ADP-ribosylglycohydrolase family protein [Deinococcota bacterium]|nr:ADP-ribosylglycohydrolase family protein [Deinococcota bacterium]